MSSPSDARVSERLKAIRKRLGKNQAELAQALDVSSRAYQRYEVGERDLPSAVAGRLQAEFGVSADWLWDGKGDMFARRIASGADFLVAGEGGRDDDGPDDMRRRLDATEQVSALLREAGLDAGMALRVVMRELIIWHSVSPEALKELVAAIKEELKLAGI